LRSTVRKFVPEAVKRRRDALHWARASPQFVAAWPLVDSIEGWLSKFEAELLFALARLVPAGQSIVEIGSYKGRSTVALAAGVRAGVPIYAVDPHTGDRTQVEAGMVIDTWDEFRANLARANAASVIPVRLPSVEAAASYCGPGVAMLFIDGWHSTEAVIADFESWKPHLVGTPTIVFDDWPNPEVGSAIDLLRGQLPREVGVIGKDKVFADSVARSVTRLVR
jgi:MMP 1-O-methyltransferase